MKYALDVSFYDAILPGDKAKYQAVDWTKSGLDLAIIKASEGLHIDPAFILQWEAAACLPRVAYHFFRSNVSAIEQATFFKQHLAAVNFTATDFVAVDFETLDNQASLFCINALASFLYEMEKFIPASRILIYTYPNFWQSIWSLKCNFHAEKYLLWLAQWPLDNWILTQSPNIFDSAKLKSLKTNIENRNPKATTLPPWTSPAIWQFSSRVDTRAVEGHPAIKKVCDLNAVYMPLGQAEQFKTCPTCGGSGKVKV